MLGDPSDLSTRDLDALNALCREVGYALWAFSNIEQSLAALYGVCAEIAKLEAAFKSHDQIREFQHRLGATDAVVQFWLTRVTDKAVRDAAAKEWNALHRIIKDDSQDRNRIAHFTIGPEEQADGRSTWYVLPYFQVFSHITAFRGMGSGPLKLPQGVRKFDIKAMRAKTDRFGKTALRIDALIKRFCELGAQLPKSS